MKKVRNKMNTILTFLLALSLVVTSFHSNVLAETKNDSTTINGSDKLGEEVDSSVENIEQNEDLAESEETEEGVVKEENGPLKDDEVKGQGPTEAEKNDTDIINVDNSLEDTQVKKEEAKETSKEDSLQEENIENNNDSPEVVFENSTLRNAVANELDIHSRPVTEADMKLLTDLSLRFYKIQSLEGLQYAENLKTLDAFGNKLTDISPIQNLTKLQKLDLGSNQITDISLLQHLSRLESLDLRSNNISDPSVIQKFTKLKSLNLGENYFTDIDFIAGLTDLDYLSLNDNNITNITALKNLNKLTYLDLYNNRITSVESIKELVNLKHLYIGENQISDLSPLNQLLNISFLILDNNHITDISILSNFKELEYLELSNNQIADITPLKNLNKLYMINLSYNKISDISALSGLKELEFLYFDDNLITNISVLRNFQKLQFVYLTGMEFTDPDTIHYLSKNGVLVQVDGMINGEEMVFETFPQEQGFTFDFENNSILVDLNKQPTTSTIKLTSDQVKMLVANNLTLHVINNAVQVSIPALTFDYNSEPVIIDINEIVKTPNSLSNTYDFTIKQGTRNISQFEDAITLTFKVNTKLAKNTDMLKVFYLNEETKEWENVGGTYKNGQVTTTTNHFSAFTVFEVAGNDENSKDIVIVEDELENENDDDNIGGISKKEPNSDSNNGSSTVAMDTEKEKQQDPSNKDNNKLPQTATNVHNFLVVGMLLLLTGLIIYMINRKKIYNY